MILGGLYIYIYVYMGISDLCNAGRNSNSDITDLKHPERAMMSSRSWKYLSRILCPKRLRLNRTCQKQTGVRIEWTRSAGVCCCDCGLMLTFRMMAWLQPWLRSPECTPFTCCYFNRYLSGESAIAYKFCHSRTASPKPFTL